MEVKTSRTGKAVPITIILIVCILNFCSNINAQTLWSHTQTGIPHTTEQKVNTSCGSGTTYGVTPLPGRFFVTIDSTKETIVQISYWEETQEKATKFDLLPASDMYFRIPEQNNFDSPSTDECTELQPGNIRVIRSRGFDNLSFDNLIDGNQTEPTEKFLTIDEYDVSFEWYWAGDYTLNGSPALSYSSEWGEGMTLQDVSKFLQYRSDRLIVWLQHDSLWYRIPVETQSGDSCHIIEDGVFVAADYEADLTPGLDLVKLNCGIYSPLQVELDEYDAAQMDRMNDSCKVVSLIEEARQRAEVDAAYRDAADSIRKNRLDEKYPLLFQGGLLMGQIAHDGRIQGEGFSASIVAFHSVPRTPLFIKGQLFYNEWDGQDRWTKIDAKEIIASLGLGYGIRAGNLTAAAFLNVGYQNTVQQETELFVNDGGRYRQASPAALLSISFLANYQIPKTPFAFSSTLDFGKLVTSGAGDSIVGKGSSKIANNTTTRNIVQAGFTWTF
jgi:hypothetical protein